MYDAYRCISIGRFDHFFFFQAEDGIRDADVTGVQTCALPISNLKANHNSVVLHLFLVLVVSNGSKILI